MFKLKKDKENEVELSPDQKKTRAAIILAIYAVFFIFLFIFLITSNNDNDNKKSMKTINDTKEETKDITISDRINNFIKTNNYSYEYTFGNDLTITGKIVNKENLLNKTYNNKAIDYYINDIYYYKLENNKFKKIDSLYLYEDYENTFTNINNVIKLFKSINKTTIKQNNSRTIEKFYIELNDYYKIYNDINLTNYIDNENTKIENSVEYNDDYITITLDMSEFYNKKNEILYVFKYENKDNNKIEVTLK